MSTRRHIENTSRVVTTQGGVIPDGNEYEGLPGTIDDGIPIIKTNAEWSFEHETRMKAVMALMIPK